LTDNPPMRPNLFLATLSCLLFNTAIAGLLTLVGFEDRFWLNFVFSQCIGLSIYAINVAAMCRVHGRQRWLVLALTFPVSIVLGVSLAIWITGVGDWSDPRAWVTAVIGLFFGGIGSITYFLSERIDRLDAEIRQRQLIQSETERRALEAQLKLLQAQIEPHFLFNTLANVGSLIDSDPVAARRLLDRLNDWLRVALARARGETATLGDELAMLENYLEILAVRFGDRLRWRIEVDAAARRQPFPPMLLQPLVENAVRHGIEPKLGGGGIVIRAAQGEAGLRIEVRDDGAGLSGESGMGTGLGNVKARLAALYGNAGRLTLESPAEGGVTASLEIP
jgi:sensor histidine kinase YesM